MRHQRSFIRNPLSLSLSPSIKHCGRANRSFSFFLLALFAILLSSCSHTSKHDGPPNYNVDVSHIPNAVPKPEPLAKYGNYKSYIVFGKRYYTIRDRYKYDEIGTASWYGTKFHARKTSSGERYDMLGMTAAHKSLMLPTYVEVTNLKNNRRVIVKVNDRGPFESNRIIDLSYAAAKKLDMLAHGTATVRVRAINPYRYDSREPFFMDSPHTGRPLFASNEHPRETIYPAFHPAYQHGNSKGVYLQVGAFRNRHYALRLQQRLANVSRAPVSVVNPSGRLYKVKIGPFHDKVTLARTASRLIRLGVKPNRIYG